TTGRVGAVVRRAAVAAVPCGALPATSLVAAAAAATDAGRHRVHAVGVDRAATRPADRGGPPLDGPLVARLARTARRPCGRPRDLRAADLPSYLPAFLATAVMGDPVDSAAAVRRRDPPVGRPRDRRPPSGRRGAPTDRGQVRRSSV